MSDSRADGAMRLITHRISTGEESAYLKIEFEFESLVFFLNGMKNKY